MSYFGTHNHSDASNLGGFKDSICKIEDLILTAHELGLTGIALTDHGNISLHIKAMNLEKQLKQEGKLPETFRVVLGVEGYVVDRSIVQQARATNQPTSFYHLVILPKNEVGHRALRELVDQSFVESFTYRGVLRTPMYKDHVEAVMKKYPNSLVVTTACLGGEFAKRVLAYSDALDTHNETLVKQAKQQVCESTEWLIQTFGYENVFIELQPSEMEDQIAFNQMALKVATAYGLPSVVATDTHYLRPEDREIHKAFLTSDKKGNQNREVDAFYSTTYLHTADEIRASFPYLETEVVETLMANTQLIQAKCEFFDLSKPQEIPKLPLPPKQEWADVSKFDPYLSNYPSLYEMATSEEPYNQYFANQVLGGLCKRNVPEHDFHRRLERINQECYEILGISKKRNEPISAYFITMKETMDWMWDEAETVIGVSRGSVSGYESCFMLGITQLSPLDYGVEIPHWRST